jgi:hypothetical protein
MYSNGKRRIRDAHGIRECHLDNLTRYFLLVYLPLNGVIVRHDDLFQKQQSVYTRLDFGCITNMAIALRRLAWYRLTGAEFRPNPTPEFLATLVFKYPAPEEYLVPPNERELFFARRRKMIQQSGGRPRNLLSSPEGVRPSIWPRSTTGGESLTAALAWLDQQPDPNPTAVQTAEEEDTSNYGDL